MNVKKIMPVFLAVPVVFPAMTRTKWLTYPAEYRDTLAVARAPVWHAAAKSF